MHRAVVTGINYDDLQLDSGRVLDPLLRVHAGFVLHPGVHFVPKLAERRISPPRTSGQAQNSCDLPAHLPLLASQSQLQGNDSADPTIKGFSVLVHLLEQLLLALSELLGLISPPGRDLDTISARFTLHTPNLAIQVMLPGQNAGSGPDALELRADLRVGGAPLADALLGLQIGLVGSRHLRLHFNYD